MAEVNRRYLFHPLERRGVLFGLDGRQLATVAGGLLIAVLAGRAVGGAGGTVLAVLLVASTAALALWPKAGKPVVHWLPVAGGWLARGAGRTITDPAPLQVSKRDLAPRGITLLATAGGMGMIRDRHGASWAAVLPVRGRSFPLLDPEEQDRRLAAWRAVLGAIARPGTPVRRVQWVERSRPEVCTARPFAPGGSVDDVTASARGSYERLVAGAEPAQTHDVWLLVSVGGTSAVSASEALGRELRLLEGQLKAADLQPEGPLGRDELAALLAGAHRRRGSLKPWPMGAEDRWGCWRADDLWHATYWIAEWPRVDVPGDFISPLLMAGGRRAVSVIMAPVPAERAVRQARSSRTADLADAELRSKAGFLSSARRDRESEGARQREQELADGHSEFLFSGYVTVSADSPDGLEAACAEAEHSAQSAHLELRRLYGRQAEAFTWTLPLGRGLGNR